MDNAVASGEYDDWPVLEVELSDDVGALIKANAKQAGVTVEDYIVALVCWYIDSLGLAEAAEN